MSNCKVPGCDGTIVRVIETEGNRIRQEDLPSPYDANASSKFKKMGYLKVTYHCDTCGISYYFIPKDPKEPEHGGGLLSESDETKEP